MDLTLSHVSHPSEELLESYALEHLSEAEQADLEEHLLLCPACQRSLARIDEFVSLMESAHAAPLRLAVSIAVGSVARWWRRVRSIVPPTSTALTRTWGLGAASIGLVLEATLPHPSGPPVRVSLTPLHGSAVLASPASAGRSLNLRIDSASPQAGGGRGEIVDADGSPVWSGRVQHDAGDSLIAYLGKPLAAGVYRIRLYSAHGELMCEFPLRVE